jgi:hypothetical protein
VSFLLQIIVPDYWFCVLNYVNLNIICAFFIIMVVCLVELNINPAYFLPDVLKIGKGLSEHIFWYWYSRYWFILWFDVELKTDFIEFLSIIDVIIINQTIFFECWIETGHYCIKHCIDCITSIFFRIENVINSIFLLKTTCIISPFIRTKKYKKHIFGWNIK